jgi:hypothetical protein
MLDAILSRVGCLRRGYRCGHMTCERNTKLVSLVRDGKVSIARQQRIDLDEIRATRFLLGYRLAPLRFIGDGDAGGIGRLRTIKDGAIKRQAQQLGYKLEPIEERAAPLVYPPVKRV